MFNEEDYSPTVSNLYEENENWFRENCKNEEDIYDIEGYDSYGYDDDGFDRSGHDKDYYMFRDNWQLMDQLWNDDLIS